MDNLNNFWIQPSEGYSEKTTGRTETQIYEREQIIGFKFPKLYKEIMMLQNGGYMHKRAFPFKDGVRELFYNGAIIDPIENLIQGYNTFEDVLKEYLDEDEIKKYAKSEYCFPKRLPIISHMDGHSFLCFDYGWLEEKEKSEPEICLFDIEGVEGFEEILRLSNFENLIENLYYFGYESDNYIVGINNELALKDIKNIIEKLWELNFEEQTSYQYGGWYNFGIWYSATYKNSESIKFTINLTPNQFLSGTYLQQSHTDTKAILTIQNEIDAINEFRSEFIEKMLKKLSEQLSFEIILKPYLAT